MKVEWVTTEAEWLEAATLLQQLRPQYCVEQLVRQMQKQAEAGYRLAVVRSAGRVIAVAGFVVGEKLAWGRHIYVDDLVVDEACRGSGGGTVLIEWLKAHCAAIGADQLHLDSGVQRFAAHRFYLRHGFNIASHHFSISGLTSKD